MICGLSSVYAETGVQILGSLKLITPPSGMVVTRKEAKEFARVLGNDDDALVDRCIRTATNLCEKMISGHRQFLTAQYSVAIGGVWSGPLKMPRPPLQTIDGIFYFDSDNASQSLESDSWFTQISDGQPGTVELRHDLTLPSLWCDRQWPIEIRFTCGYGAAADVPDEIKTAVLTVCTQLYCVRCTIDPDVLEAISRYLENAVGYGSYA